MAFTIFVPKESAAGEKRVALVPDVAGRLVKLGFEVVLESHAGLNASFPDAAYQAAGAKLTSDVAGILSKAPILLAVQMPGENILELLKEGTILVGMLAPHRNAAQIGRLREKKIFAFSMELLPRITRAQSMDVLSSQATVAGYKAALMAAHLSKRFFPMLTTAAGTIRPVKALVLGAGVAGLQAIATARRLGAIVEAYDVRRVVKEQVESLGARFLEIQVDAAAEGGYARELTAEEKQKEKEMLAKHVALSDCVITTAQIPGRKAPLLLSEEMVAAMKPGSVVVDLAAESGGNCALTKAGEVVNHNGVFISGPLDIPSELSIHASEMYAKNLYNFLLLLTKEGKSLEIDWKDEILSASCVTREKGES